MSFRLEDLESADLQDPIDLKVEFLHRSLHDFLLTPKMQELLHQYTGGPLNARVFLCNARLVEFMALTSAGVGQELAVGLSELPAQCFVGRPREPPHCSGRKHYATRNE